MVAMDVKKPPLWRRLFPITVRFVYICPQMELHEARATILWGRLLRKKDRIITPLEPIVAMLHGFGAIGDVDPDDADAKPTLH